MLARVKEFDDDMWPGWWFKRQPFLKANHLGHGGMIETIVAETDVAKTEQCPVERRGQETVEVDVLRARSDDD